MNKTKVISIPVIIALAVTSLVNTSNVFASKNNAKPTVRKVAAPVVTTFRYNNVTLSNKQSKAYSVKVIKTNKKIIGFARSNQTVYVTGSGLAKVYWFNKSKLPKRTNLRLIKNYTISNAVRLHKTLSTTQ